MNLNVASWNVRGLESSDRKYIVKRFLDMSKELDMLLLHEVKAIVFALILL